MAFWRNVTFWHSSGTVLSILIALAAAGFTGMQLLEARNQLLLSTKPHVDFDTESDPDKPPVGIAINNAGPGPALINSVNFYVDRKPVQDADEAGRTYAKLSASEFDAEIIEPNDTLGVGEKNVAYTIPQTASGKNQRK
jgi:hypothetical protein